MRLKIIDQTIEDIRFVPEKEVQKILVGILQISLVPKQQLQEGIEGIRLSECIQIDDTYTGIAVDLNGEILRDILLLRCGNITAQLAAHRKVGWVCIQQRLYIAAAQNIGIHIQNLVDPVIQKPGREQAEYGAGGPIAGGDERCVLVAEQPDGIRPRQQSLLIFGRQNRTKTEEGNAVRMVFQNGHDQIDALIDIVIVERQQNNMIVLTEGCAGVIRYQSEIRTCMIMIVTCRG